MISEKSIQEVRDRADILEVTRRYAELKKSGSNYKGCCPFHDEKTGSFMVNPAKGIYKCFGCGAGGADAIKFIMDKDRLSFPDAVRSLAAIYNVELEETHSDDGEAKEAQVKKMDFYTINKWAAKTYQGILLEILRPGFTDGAGDWAAIELLGNRLLTYDTVISFQLGFAPADGRTLAPHLVQMGRMAEAEELGLARKGQNGNYDVFRNRIIFPIHNERGEVAGFGARKQEDGKKDNPKYINSRESSVYNKSALFYGLYQAERSIRNGIDPKAKDGGLLKEKFATTVEGYFDVISWHQGGVTNTIAACGTAFTDQHAKLLKRFTNHVLLVGDGDSAGERSNLKTVDVLLRHGFKVEHCPMPEDEDPDSLARKLSQGIEPEESLVFEDEEEVEV
jgi:DNA primase